MNDGNILPPQTQSDADEQREREAVFVLQYVETGDPIVAYTRAGLTDQRWPIHVAASKFLQKPEIQASIEAVQKLTHTSVPIKVTRDSLVSSYQDIYEKALADRQYNAASNALKMQAALLGMLDQKITVTHSYKAEDMSDAELLRIINGGGQQIVDGEFKEIVDAG